MILLTENKSQYWEEIIKLKPRLITSFSPINADKLRGLPLKIILHKQAWGKQPIPLPPQWEVKSNSKLHAKMVVGEKGVYIGSWNIGSQELHEVGIITHDTNIIIELAEYFNTLWERSN